MFVALLFAVVTSGGTGIPAGPPGDAFYVPPEPLPKLAHGTPIWARRITGGAALPSAAANYQMLYETLGPDGRAIAVSGTIAVPAGTPPAGGWPLVSWAHGTTGNAPQCAPSRSSEPNVEQRMLDGFVKRGYAVALTDYEGNGTPGPHPYFVASSLARDVTDAARAARAIDPAIGQAWIVMGHSEGGTVALATGALDSRYAPELHLVGVVSYAPGTYLEGLLQSALLGDAPNGSLVFVALLIEGFSAVDPRVVPAQILEPAGMRMMAELHQRCVNDLMRDSDWSQTVPRSIFRPAGQSGVEALARDVGANEPDYFSIAVPVLLVQGNSDALINPRATLLLHDHLCRRGPATIKVYGQANHSSVMAMSADDVAAWVAQRFAGTPITTNC